MKELFLKLFEMSHFDTGIQITPFSVSHIVYMLLIGGGIVAAWLVGRRKDAAFRQKLLRFLAYGVVVSYISDFFMHPFVYPDLDGLSINKLPFHVCTVLCPLMAYAQFGRKGSKILEPVAMLSVLAPTMYLCFPASVGTGEPWCYQAVQTMFYHGALLAWAVLNLAFGTVKPDVKNCWKSAAVLVGITLWATLGNSMNPGQNWFFLEEDAFYIGLVSGGIIPQWLLMIVNPLVFFLAVLALYGLCHWIGTPGKKKAAL